MGFRRRANFDDDDYMAKGDQERLIREDIDYIRRKRQMENKRIYEEEANGEHGSVSEPTERDH